MTSESFTWASRVRLVDEVFQVLRERIYTRRYTPGESLPQVKIAAELNISRTPLREAFRMLEKEGLVTVTSSGTVRVVNVDLRSLLHAYELREVVDGLAARLAAERGGAQAETRLQPLLASQRTALEPWLPQKYTEANVQFHVAIYEMADNEFLRGQFPMVRMTAQVFAPTALLSRERVFSAIAEHVELTQAIQAGEGERAERLARAHIRRSITALQQIATTAAQADVPTATRTMRRKRK
jgi:DNA-binding GntR family transcriptional regulator